MLRKLFTLLFTCFFLVVTGNSIQYGLTFYSHSVNQDLRTSLNLTPDGPLSLPVGFSFEFLIKFNPAKETYGYVCRLISNDTKTFDIISNINGRKLNCVLIDVDKALSNVDFKITDSSNKKSWYKIKIEFQSDKIDCYLDNEVKSIPYSFTNFKNIRICFGRNLDKMFYSSDVPPISIKDLIIRNEKGEVLLNWQLSKYTGNKVFDSIKNKLAIVDNGSWDIDKYIRWNKIISIPIVENNPQLAYNSIKNIFYVATADSLFSINMQTDAIEKKKTKKGSPYATNMSSQLIYDSTKNRLISYCHSYPELNYYNFETNEWSGNNHEWSRNNIYKKLGYSYSQHNRFVDFEKNRLVIFGGYGYQTYKGLLSFHPLDTDKWEIKDFSNYIEPRYLSALGYMGDGKFLILGGYGSLSGKQEESPKNFYDLYEIDSRRLTCKKLFDLTIPMHSIVFSNSMVIDENKKNIYALGFDNQHFHTSLQLCEISLINGAVTVLANSIPYNFNDMESFCDLILDKEKSTLYAVLLQKVSEHNTMDIYSLSYPPLKISDVTQQDVSEDKKKSIIPVFLLMLFSGLIIIGAIARKRKKQKYFLTEEEVWLEQGGRTIEKFSGKSKNVSTIKLLGGFQVFDKEGNDITDSFTPILKQIFLFILLSSIKDGRKITSETLDETFWFDMDTASALNNRSVNVRKLRLLLEKIGNIVLSNKRSYWFIDISDDVTCDYKEIMALLRQARDEESNIQKIIDKVLDISQNGVLLPTLNIEWLDDYKSEYSTLLMELLSKATSITEINTNPRLLVKIANVMLLHDSIDEEAIRIKCRTLFILGQKGLSKQCFDRFIQDYQRLLNETPKINYEDIIA